MKQQLSKSLSFFLLVATLIFVASSPVYASEVTGTLSTGSGAPYVDASGGGSGLGSVSSVPATSNSLSGMVTGGAQAPATKLGAGNLNTWVWITIFSLFIVGATIYFYQRPSRR